MSDALVYQPDRVVADMRIWTILSQRMTRPWTMSFQKNSSVCSWSRCIVPGSRGVRFLQPPMSAYFMRCASPPLVPDMFLSLDVQPDEDIWRKENRSYFLWKFGKPPEVVVEVVSNKEGGELNRKLRLYARMGVWYYVVFDPEQLMQESVLRVYGLSIARYFPQQDLDLTEVGLKLTLWDGVFEGLPAQWLRWVDAEGSLLLTGMERAAQEQQRAERLAEQLRALGIEPENGQGNT